MMTGGECSGFPVPTYGCNNGSTFRLPSGIFVDACLVFKAAWTEWHKLFLKALDNNPGFKQRGGPFEFFPFAVAPLVPRYTPAAASCGTYRFIIVRNPCEPCARLTLEDSNSKFAAHTPC